MIKIVEIKKENCINEKCPECGRRLVITGFEKTCTICGLVINEIFGDSSYVIKDGKTGHALGKQYVALGEKTDYIGGLGSCIDYEKSKYIKDKSGRLLPANDQIALIPTPPAASNTTSSYVSFKKKYLYFRTELIQLPYNYRVVMSTAH